MSTQLLKSLVSSESFHPHKLFSFSKSTFLAFSVELSYWFEAFLVPSPIYRKKNIHFVTHIISTLILIDKGKLPVLKALLLMVSGETVLRSVAHPIYAKKSSIASDKLDQYVGSSAHL